jgi:hypothetical protein
MSWEQSYNVPSVESLLEKLTGFDSRQLLESKLACQGILIKSEEDVVLDDGMYQTVIGRKVTLSDGRVFVPKLVKSETANGNWGCDTYEYVLENETPKVEYVDHDEEILDSNPDNCCGDLNDCGC